jgi:D-alanine-D-alanine ligase-like ATP-grasp enzyme
VKRSNFKKKSCEYCGNNPVPHLVYWYFESLNILLSPIRQFLLKVFSFVKLPSTSKFFLWFGVKFGIIKFQDDINKCKVDRAKVLWEEAIRRGIKMRELLLFGKPFDTYIAEKYQIPPVAEPMNGHATGQANSKFQIVFSGLPRPKHINRAALDVMDDKSILKQKFLKAGLPAPLGGSAWNFWQAKKIFESINKPVIVKPRAGSRGRHSTIYIQTIEALKFAYKVAKKLCFWVVVEEQLFGPVYRATLINYELCGVLRGDSPQVVGDGVSSIRQLIQFKNSSSHPGVKDIVVDNSLEVFLQKQNLNLSSILEKERLVNLSEKIGVNYGGSSSEDYEICHADNKELFVRAAKVVGDPIVGFDFIIPDITKSWKEQKCGFLEANSLPFINLHHHPLLGRPKNVAAKVWEMIGFTKYE